jgi:hypothetical protein
VAQRFDIFLQDYLLAVMGHLDIRQPAPVGLAPRRAPAIAMSAAQQKGQQPLFGFLLVDIVDCMLAASSSEQAPVVSFDQDLDRLKALTETI